MNTQNNLKVKTGQPSLVTTAIIYQLGQILEEKMSKQ